MDEGCLLYHFSSIFIWFVCVASWWNLSTSGLIIDFKILNHNYRLLILWDICLYPEKNHVSYLPLSLSIYSKPHTHINVLVVWRFVKSMQTMFASWLWHISWININSYLSFCFAFFLQGNNDGFVPWGWDDLLNKTIFFHNLIPHKVLITGSWYCVY